MQNIANKQKKVLIVGGVAGGASAAVRLRRLDESAEIIIFERDGYISYANCGLPYYIGETIKDRDDLLIQTPESINERFNIDVRIHSEVTNIDTKAKKVTVKNIEKGFYEEDYDYLILSPGAKAIRPNIPGIGNEKIFTLRNINDTDAIKDYIDKNEVNNAVVVGGGFVGIEMAESLNNKGIRASIVEAAPHVLASFDSDMATIIEKELLKYNMEIILNDKVTSFAENGKQITVTLNSGTELNADLVILTIGVAPDTAFLKNCGLEFSNSGHILVNEKMQTNIDGIYAVGDAVELVSFITKQKTVIPLAGQANKQGRIAADNVSGIESTYKGTQGTTIIKIFGATAAATGANEKTLKAANIPYKVIYIHPASHASYYPGAKQMTLKIIFTDKGKLLGAQCFGYDGVDKRVDVLATVIRLNGTVNDLTELELSYAPPYSSAKDPVNMAGYVAENYLSGRSHMIRWQELVPEQYANSILLDARTEEEFAEGHMEGAINIPVDSLRSRLGELDKSKNIIIYCQVGLRAYIADRILSQNGFDVLNLTGGHKLMSALNYHSLGENH